MSRHYISADAQCPFYKEEDKNHIYCEGVTENSRLCSTFNRDAEGYKREFCCDCWKNCRIARMLWEKYE